MSEPAPSPRRPNVVLVMTDQHRHDHVGFAGAPVDTPHLDALAARSRVFRNAWVANPICQPNRSTILTGRVPSAHGTRHNGISLDPRSATFVRQLREAGYRTGVIGKLHVQNMGDHPELLPHVVDPLPPVEALTVGEPGWDTWELEQRYDDPDACHEVPPDFYGFDHVELAVNHSDFAGGHYRLWLREQGVDPATVQGLANAETVSPRWDQVRRPGLPVELYPTSWIAERAEAFLARHAASDAPFFLQVSFPDPHHPFTPPGEWFDRYDPADVPVPDTFGDPHTGSLEHLRRIVADRGQQHFPLAPWAPTEEQLREAMAAEFGMISLIDTAVGRVLGALTAAGLADDTIVVFTSDHGDMFGDHGLMLKSGMHYAGCLRVPLTIAVPGVAPGPTDALVSSLDLAATVCELAGVDDFFGDQGRSLAPIVADPAAPGRDSVLVEEEQLFRNASTGRRLRMRTLVTPDARITRYHGTDRFELFDRRADPDELRNLDQDPAAIDLAREMGGALLQAMLDHVDEPRRATFLA
jgi:arylsulfatase A-like enzyme